ncbi:hypothetical protein NXY03_11960 [Bacteroides fragilis]|nr:hypothetical protein NXY03_11960 [Bacteroides fragilis]
MEEMNVPLDARRLLYHEAKTVLEQVFISPNSKDVWNFKNRNSYGNGNR